MSKAILTFLTIIFLSSLPTDKAEANDTLQRINDCEQADGANGCVYDILRELTYRSPQAPDTLVSYCECVDLGYNYLSRLVVYTDNITRGTQVSQILKNYTHDTWNRQCKADLAAHRRCQ